MSDNLQFPPRPIVPKTNAEFDDRELITTKEITLSPALLSKLESLRAHMMICVTRDCPTCSERQRRYDLIVEQFKAEMTPLWDLRKSITVYQDENAALKAFIEHNWPDGTVEEILKDYRDSHIKRIK